MSHGHSRDDVLNYTLRQFNGYLKAISQIEREQRFSMLAASIASAGEDAFKQAVKMLGLDDG